MGIGSRNRIYRVLLPQCTPLECTVEGSACVDLPRVSKNGERFKVVYSAFLRSC